MADGVQQDHELTLPSRDMENQTDVGMAREDRGQMTSTECQVNALNSSGPVQVVLLHLVTAKFLKKPPRKEAFPLPQVSSYPPSPTHRHTQTSNFVLKNRCIFLAFDYKLPVVKLSWYFV